MMQALLQGSHDPVELVWGRRNVVVLGGPGNRGGGIERRIDVFQGHDISAQKSLALHAGSQATSHFPIEEFLHVIGFGAPDASLGNLELDDDVLFLEARILAADKINRTDLADGHPSQFDQRADGKVLNLAGDVGFENVALAEVGLQADSEKSGYQQRGSGEDKEADPEIVSFDAHAAWRLRNCRTHGCEAWSRSQAGGPSATMPRVCGSSRITRSAT